MAKRSLYYLKGLFKYYLIPRHDLMKRYGGGWVFITGASDGMGLAHAHELARTGFNIVLMARNKEKLENVARELQEKYKVKTRVVVFNFGSLGTEESI